jgi:DNA primase
VQKLFRFTDTVVFSFDGDEAGRRAARKALDIAIPFATDVRSVKFLFLPTEHDPDSFIRAHGRDAFSRYIGEATPLSRFLIEAAREGCDLGTAEGRAHMAANAKPMWTALPDGALKRQLLAEIAALAQLETRELASMWGARHALPPSRRRDAAPVRRPARTLPPERADRALQIVFMNPGAWGDLSNDDHHLLSDLAPPHGPLFSWLDAHVHEHGPEPWETLKTAIAGHEFQDFLLDQARRVLPDIEHDLSELRNILQKEHARVLAERKRRLAERAPGDPAAYEELRRLIESEKTTGS